MTIRESIYDLYDFDYYAGTLSLLGATVQHGWNSGLSSSVAQPSTGMIFWDTIKVNKTCSYAKDDFGILTWKCY